MFELIDEAIDHYCELHTTDEDDLLFHLNRATHLKVLRSRMISGKLQGAFLSMIAKMMQPKNILEIGTYTGYSALCLAEGLHQNGFIHTIDINEEFADFAQQYFEKSDKKNQIITHIGDAKEIIPTLDYEWDLVFIDAEKKDYLDYYQLVLPKVRKGGYLLADNVLWSGKVVETVKANDHETQKIMAFNQFVQKDERVKNMMLPFRDGILCIEKL